MRISVITISFNQLAYLKHAVASIRGQNYEDLEHIVIDAGSTDGSREWLAQRGDPSRLRPASFSPTTSTFTAGWSPRSASGCGRSPRGGADPTSSSSCLRLSSRPPSRCSGRGCGCAEHACGCRTSTAWASSRRRGSRTESHRRANHHRASSRGCCPLLTACASSMTASAAAVEQLGAARIESVWSGTGLISRRSSTDLGGRRAASSGGGDEIIALHSGAMGRKQELENVVEAAGLAWTPRGARAVRADGQRRGARATRGDRQGVPGVEFVDPLPGKLYQAALDAAGRPPRQRALRSPRDGRAEQADVVLLQRPSDRRGDGRGQRHRFRDRGVRRHPS